MEAIESGLRFTRVALDCKGLPFIQCLTVRGQDVKSLCSGQVLISTR